MIFGVFERNNGSQVNPDKFQQAFTLADSAINQTEVYLDGQIGFAYQSPFETTRYKTLKPVASVDKNLAVVFSGRIYNSVELSRLLDLEFPANDIGNGAWLVLHLYEKFGPDFVTKLNGKFAFAIWDKTQQKLILGRDRLGIEPLYYFAGEERLIFSSAIQPIFRYSKIEKVLNYQAIGKFLLFTYNPGLQTFFQGVYKLRPAHLLIAGSHELHIQRYWNLSFDNVLNTSEQEIADGLFASLQDAVSIRLDGEVGPGVFLSGGMDSSTVIALTKAAADFPLHSFSYRCKSKSFDESHYARLMAEHTGAVHHEIEYSSRDVLSMPEIVKEMNEPFCDVGINIATYILGREASQHTSYILTGDGGDELFGGHPVYEADKVVRFVEPIPGVLRRPFIDLFSRLPDSDEKKNLTVKIKRFVESLGLPKELLSHRWRIYYHANELKQLLTPTFAGGLDRHNLYEDILQFTRETDGADLLSRSLYSDYQSVMDFYLRRNDLNRQFRLETRYPLLDHRLVEYCATIPSRLKIKGWFDTKYIFKKTMERVLPHDIVYRKDKLGHSIPLKNWLRDNQEIKDFVLDFTTEDTIQKRGMFHYAHVRRLVDGHLTKRRNNSHRLWALAVLEMWLREHYDSK